MKKSNKKLRPKHSLFEKIASRVTKAAGSPISFICAVLLVLIWALTGPFFNYSSTWQLVINTTTTIITFLMVFVIQQSQNKETLAIQLKLNELLACEEKASNRIVDVEDLTEEELTTFRKFYKKLSELAAKENDLHSSHSIDEANDVQDRKKISRQKLIVK